MNRDGQRKVMVSTRKGLSNSGGGRAVGKREPEVERILEETHAGWPSSFP